MNGRLFAEVFITLVVIMDPLGSVPIFLSLTAGRSQRTRRRMAWQAVAVAFFVIVLFAVFGQQILDYLHITLPALRGAGGLLLILVALDLLTGKSSDPASMPDVNVALVPLGTPLFAGPGAIAATILFVEQSDGGRDLLAIAAAIVAVHVALWLSLRSSVGVLKVVREGGIQLITRIFGLLLSAIAVQFIADAVRGFIEATP
ncbi:MAG TPA: MarC family protein [Mycobacteriales bacterium]|nr:MarC family protein [Mycobacteriales bacterium]